MTTAKNALEEESVEEEETPEEFDPKTRWLIPQNVDQMAFVGKDVLAVAHDVYIMFINLRTGLELVYSANCTERGDGVDVIAGHRTNMFAFAEKAQGARIFIVMYPSFQTMIELKDKEINRYKGLCLMEGELIAGFGSFPDYRITVWCWRLQQRLVSVPTHIVQRRQLFVASRTHMLVCQSDRSRLVVWEVAPAFHRCFLMRRAMAEGGHELVSVCWTHDGLLYACDADSKLYAITSDGINMVPSLEWSDEDMNHVGSTFICSFGTGILMYSCDHKFRWLKRVEPKSDQVKEQARVRWLVSWARRVETTDHVVRLAGGATDEGAAAWTRGGTLLRLRHKPQPGDEDFIDMRLIAYKQRNIVKVKLIAPTFNFLAAMNDVNELCIYEVMSAKLVLRKYLDGTETSFELSPTEPLLAVFGANGTNYGLALYRWSNEQHQLSRAAHVCLTHQQVARVVFSPTGRELVAAAMAAGHIFIYNVTTDHQLQLVRYTEFGRGLADCLLMKVGQDMRAFALVLFSDKFLFGERIICINAVSGKDNKFAGKMKGPYSRLLPLSVKDTMLAIPFGSRHMHILKLSGEKGMTVSVKIGAIIDSEHELRQFDGVRSPHALLTYGMAGAVFLRRPDGSSGYVCKTRVSHRFEQGVQCVSADAAGRLVVSAGMNRTVAVTVLAAPRADPVDDVRHEPVSLHHYDRTASLAIFDADEKNYLDLQEEKKVREEALDYKIQREEVVRTFTTLQHKLVELLEENIAEVPLHKLSLSEFNLHMEYKKERLRQAEKEREEIRLSTEARIRAQDQVTAWIEKTCWDTMLVPRVKIFALFTHYHVENYPLLPTQRNMWPELQRVEELRSIEMENDVFRPWEELVVETSQTDTKMKPTSESAMSVGSRAGGVSEPGPLEDEPLVLAGTAAQKYVPPTACMIPQTLAYSYLHMNMLYQIVQINVQNMRMWFNKKFDELMATKKRECGLVLERNTRLRFILEELNKLSDLRGSFHHLMIQIHDPEWRQEEEPIKLTKVLMQECTITPWKSHISLPPPELKPKDDFRERALNEMMDGVLEKLWHEEIKKPIPKPQCMVNNLSL